MMYKRMLISFALVCGFMVQGMAQHNLGIATGEYSSINNLYLNPASISGSHEVVVVNLFSLSLAVDNSLGTFSKVGDIGKNNTNAFNFAPGNTPFSMLVPAMDMHLPGVMVSLRDKLQQSFALNFRVRAMNQFNHFDPSLYSTVTNNTHPDQDYHFVTSKFNWTAHVWSEIGLTYALQVMENGPHHIKVGVTLKYLGGVDYLSLKGNNLDVTYKQGNDTFYASKSDLEFASNTISADNAFTNGVSASNVLGSLFGAKAGSGFGMDIGVTYTYVLNAGEFMHMEGGGGGAQVNDAHKLSASVAVTDIGSIKYKADKNFVVNVSGDGYLTGKGLSDHLKDYNDFRDYVTTQGFHADTGHSTTKVYMPTALVAGVDYQIFKSIYFNTIFIGNLANRQNFGNSYYSQITFTPRFEDRFFTIGLPVTYSFLAHDVKLGLGFRIGGFFFGGDDMMALLSSNQHGFGFYFGGYVPIFKKDKKDRY